MIVVLLLLIAVFAPWLAPQDPNWQDAASRLQPLRPPTGWEPTAMAVTCCHGSFTARVRRWGWWPGHHHYAACRPAGGHFVWLLRWLAGTGIDALYRRGDVNAAPDPRVRVCRHAGPGLVNGALALALTTWPAYARQARSEIQRLRHSDYLAAAEMMGIRGWRLLLGHILPLCLPSAIVRLALDLAGIILAAAGLGFLGLGARPPMAEWGAMIADGMQVIFDQWWIAAAPGAVILLASLAFNLLGDGLRDVLEPQHD
jgi:peptide/nickel transport system permease protein